MPSSVLSSSYDHCYLLDSEESCETCYSRMTMLTDMTAMQLYTSDDLKTTVERNSGSIRGRSGVRFETQFSLDAPNNRFAEMCILRKGQRYEHRTMFGFGS